MSAIDSLLKGAVDLHFHSHPSPFPRAMDAAEAAERYDAAGFRAVVMKSHHHSTVMEILALERLGLSKLRLKVFGGIALNGAVGGLNPRAVDLAIQMGGKVVWFPTIASANHIEHHRAHPDLKFPSSDRELMEEEPLDVFGSDGDLRPEVHQIIGLIADADVILASGHMNPRQIEAVFEAAKGAGVRKLVLNHPDFVIGASHADAARLAELGAVVEHSLCMYDEDSKFYLWPVEHLVEWVEAVGPERTSLGSDLGQKGNPLPVDTFKKVCARLLEAGVKEKDVRMMIADNPAQLLGLT
jgi:Family of unknown function (DUF6282)